MINKLKCMFKGHKFMMNYDFNQRRYSASSDDLCTCCNARRKQILIADWITK